jgi:hypothetical protein
MCEEKRGALSGLQHTITPTNHERERHTPSNTNTEKHTKLNNLTLIIHT